VAVRAFWQVITAPGAVYVEPEAQARLDRYAYLAAWEQGTVFATGTGTALAPQAWAETLKSQLRLYRHTRLVWNPVPDLTDFWGSVVYPGVLPRDGQGKESAIPFPDDTDPALVAVAAQVWWWSGMQHLKYVIPHWAAVAGNVLVEVVDALPEQKVYLRPVWAGLVPAIELNSAGDVLFVAKEYPVQPPGEGAQPYTYRLEVSREEYRTFKDGKPFDYNPELGRGPVWRNEWGFVPAAWVPHQPTGGTHAAPAVGSWLQELLEINSLQCLLDDAVSKGTQPIITFHTDGNVTTLGSTDKRAATADLDPTDADREGIRAFKLPKDSTTGKIDPSVDVAAVSAYLAERKQEFLRHFPEVSMWESLRNMTTVSGIAAEILHGDTRNKAIAVRAGTDRQVEKATQMAITMGAIRAAPGGGWTNVDSRRQLFRAFNANSFEDGKLDWAIDERALVPAAPLSEVQEAELAKLRQDLGLPNAWVFTEMGVPEKVVTEATAAEQAKAEADAAAAEAARLAAQVQEATNGGTSGQVDEGGQTAFA
jgi:hypothetical protein